MKEAALSQHDAGAPKAGLKTWARALRIHQWPKNLLVFIPAGLSVPVLTWADGLDTLLAFAALCAIASTTYIINDLADVASDRLHHSKRNRPFASGAIAVRHGIVAAVSLGGPCLRASARSQARRIAPLASQISAVAITLTSPSTA